MVVRVEGMWARGVRDAEMEAGKDGAGQPQGSRRRRSRAARGCWGAVGPPALPYFEPVRMATALAALCFASVKLGAVMRGPLSIW